ncbi:MAG: hypothetical protein K2J15_02930, partial [Muribaculaceae bacterium]|nr:hypothetical protein [Muribaculaceae bacterium]
MAKYTPNFKNTPATQFVLDEYTCGFAQCIDNNWNYAIYAQNPNVSIFQNEYNAGYVQGKVQTGETILATRNNSWSNFLVGSTPQDAISIEVKPEYLTACGETIVKNYNYLCDWVQQRKDDPKVEKIIRLMFRQLGIYDGAVNAEPKKDVKFEDLLLSSYPAEQSVLHAGNDPLTLLDEIFINSQYDLFDAVGDKIGLVMGYGTAKKLSPEEKPDHCTAFTRMMPDGNIFWTHNSWCCFWAQSCAVTYCIGDDFVTQNANCPGQFGSNTDFGFNGNGIGFNETTHVDLYDKTKVLGVWLTYRSAAAEQFARTIDEFYEYCSMDNTGTYLNGYHIIDANTGEIGLLDMSYNRFALFKCNGKDVTVKDSTGYIPTHLDYDHHLISPRHIFGVNQPVYFWVGYELESMNLRPMRRNQLWERIDTVQDIESAKELITYTEDREPLSIYGRWDLGYGTTEMPLTRPDGSIDAKAFSRELILDTLKNLSRVPDINGEKTSFWMKFGTAHVRQLPFIWSQSQFKNFKQDESIDKVPDALDGRWNRVKM